MWTGLWMRESTECQLRTTKGLYIRKIEGGRALSAFFSYFYAELNTSNHKAELYRRDTRPCPHAPHVEHALDSEQHLPSYTGRLQQ